MTDLAADARARGTRRPGFPQEGKADRGGTRDLFAEYRKYQAGGSGRHGNDVEEDEALREAGFAEVTGRTLEIAVPVTHGETYWRFTRSHGAGAFINGLPADKRDDFHDRLVAAVDNAGGITLHRSPTLWTGICRCCPRTRLRKSEAMGKGEVPWYLCRASANRRSASPRSAWNTAIAPSVAKPGRRLAAPRCSSPASAWDPVAWRISARSAATVAGSMPRSSAAWRSASASAKRWKTARVLALA